MTTKKTIKRVIPKRPEYSRKRFGARLTPKQATFCREFMLDKNSAAAAIRAGYNKRSAQSIGFGLLQKEVVKQEIARLTEAEIKDYKVTHQMITNELYKIAFADMNDFVEIVETGEGDAKVQDLTFKPTSALGKGNGKTIKTLEIGRRGIKLQLHSKEQALDMLAKHVGYFGVDNSQKAPNGVLLYLPDNQRGDVKQPDEEQKP